MRIDIISVLPELLESPFQHSILKRASQKGKLEIHVHNLRDYSDFKHNQVDDYQYGGGAGMVIRLEPLVKCIETLESERSYDERIYLTPDGETLNQGMANQLSLKQNLILFCGHYKGIDQRFRDHFITKEISIGDFVLSGGELPAAVLVDAIGRLLPGVLNDETSALFDSHQDGLLAPPVFTRPEVFRGWAVPKVLLSGDQSAVDEWRTDEALKRTKELRPDLLSGDEE